MRNYLKETNPQRWRAIAILDSKEEALICLGRSIYQVKELYENTWLELFCEEIKGKTKSIKAQKWIGLPSLGKWSTQADFVIPTK